MCVPQKRGCQCVKEALFKIGPSTRTSPAGTFTTMRPSVPTGMGELVTSSVAEDGRFSASFHTISTISAALASAD